MTDTRPREYAEEIGQEWIEHKEYKRKYLISYDGTKKITNEGPKGGGRYCRWSLLHWTGPGGQYSAFARLDKIGSLEECKAE
jgi:hypothetical protein